MKRLLYIAGILIVLILLGIWMFLLFVSDDTKTAVFNRFGFSGSTEEAIVEDIIDTIIPDFLQKQYLRQLTTKRVIGYAEVTNGSSTRLYFAEAGTGHVYSIDPMIEGSEERISNITIPVAKEAAVAKDGRFVAIRSGDNIPSPLTIVSMIDGNLDSYTIEEPILDFSINASNTLLYTVATRTGLEGKAYNLDTRNTQAIFSVPFRQATVIWGKELGDSHYVLPKPTRVLEGYLYRTTPSGDLSRLPASGFGFMAAGNASHVLYTKLDGTTLGTHLLDIEDGVITKQRLAFAPEKCSFSAATIYCAEGGELTDYNFPDNWYRGEVSFGDSLWNINLETNEVLLVVDVFEESGRKLDITNLTESTWSTMLYFTNKNDHSLWVYEFPPSNP